MGKNEKFKFVDIEDTGILDIINDIELIETPQKVNVDKNQEDKKEVRIHYSFEARILTMIIIVLILFVTACFLIYKVVNHTGPTKVSYNETTNSKYEVCLKNSTCEKEDIEYNADDINIIKVMFNYETRYSKSIKYNLRYNIISRIRVYDDNNETISYEKERELAELTDVSNNSDIISIMKRVGIDYQKYREEAKSYSSNAECEIIFYLNEPNEKRKVSSISIPLTSDVFTITRENTNNLNNIIFINTNLWDKESILYTIFASILIIVSLVIVYKTTRLVLRVTSNKSIYQKEVDDILREYDDIIVVARDGYESNIERELVKLDTFEDLLDIQKEKSKPIIYSRINDIKSEFLIEDDKLYKVVLKESDYE